MILGQIASRQHILVYVEAGLVKEDEVHDCLIHGDRQHELAMRGTVYDLSRQILCCIVHCLVVIICDVGIL